MTDTRITQGPDQDRPSPKCRQHHAGVRTGIQDTCCCCNPCNYIKITTNDFGMRDACCRCVPQVIYGVFTPDYGQECCRETLVFGFYQDVILDTPDGDIDKIAQYVISMFGVEIIVTLGVYQGEYESVYDRRCVWRVWDNLHGALLSETEVDHFNVTCLAVPTISVTGITGPGGCTGTMTLDDHSRVRVPFFQLPNRVEKTFSVTVHPTCGACERVPRWLWLRGRWSTDQDKLWNFADLEWDESYVAVGDQVGRWIGGGSAVYLVNDGGATCKLRVETSGVTLSDLVIEGGSDCECDLWVTGTTDAGEEVAIQCSICRVLCVNGRRSEDSSAGFVEYTWNPYKVDEDLNIVSGWSYTASGNTEDVVLIQDPYDGSLSLQFEFDADDTWQFDAYEINKEDRCSCKLSFSRGKFISITVSLGWNLGCGYCSCWTYLCGDCRCVNEKLCVFGFVDGDFWPPTVVTWDEDSLCWSGGGITVCPRADENGNCIVTILGLDLDGVSGTVCGKITSFVATTTDASLGYAQFYGASHLGNCRIGNCQTATPCAGECGQHPRVLYANLHEWNDPYEDEPGHDGDCSTDFTLYYWETVVDTGTLPSVELACGYIGFSTPVTCHDFEGKPYTHMVKMLIAPGNIDAYSVEFYCIDIYKAADGFASDLVQETLCLSLDLDYISCDPYYAEWLSSFPLTSCIGQCGDTIQRRQLIITE